MSNTARQLRALAFRLRTTSMPLADIIPTLQQAADELDAPAKPVESSTENGGPTKKLIKALADAIPSGPHPDPHAEWIRVRLDFVQKTIEHMDWLDRGVAEWRHVALKAQSQSANDWIVSDMAIRHLRAILNSRRTATQSLEAETAARQWLASIGNDAP